MLLLWFLWLLFGRAQIGFVGSLLRCCWCGDGLLVGLCRCMLVEGVGYLPYRLLWGQSCQVQGRFLLWFCVCFFRFAGNVGCMSPVLFAEKFRNVFVDLTASSFLVVSADGTEQFRPLTVEEALLLLAYSTDPSLSWVYSISKIRVFTPNYAQVVTDSSIVTAHVSRASDLKRFRTAFDVSGGSAEFFAFVTKVAAHVSDARTRSLLADDVARARAAAVKANNGPAVVKLDRCFDDLTDVFNTLLARKELLYEELDQLCVPPHQDVVVDEHVQFLASKVSGFANKVEGYSF